MASFPEGFSFYFPFLFVGARTRHCAYQRGSGGRGENRKLDKTGQAVYERITSAILNSTFILIHCRRFFIILKKRPTHGIFFQSVNSIYKHIIIIIIIITRCGLRTKVVSASYLFCSSSSSIIPCFRGERHGIM